MKEFVWDSPEQESSTPEDLRMEHYLTFRAGDNEYALSVWHVLEVLPDVTVKTLKKKKGAASFSVPFRGLSIPGVDANHIFGGEKCAWTQAVVLDVEEQPVALMIERVTGLLEVPPGTALSLPNWLKRHSGPWVSGILEREEGHLILLLDGAQLFKAGEIRQLKAFG